MVGSESVAPLTARLREIGLLHAVQGLLEWDQETYMPRKAAANRAEQIALLAGAAHERLVHGETHDLLQRAEAAAAGDWADQTNVREARRLLNRVSRVPTALVRDIARCSSLAKVAWAAAREASRFEDFAPHLDQMLRLKRALADAIGWKTERYDALMDEYEPGARAAEVQAVFEQVKPHLVALTQELARAPRQPDESLLTRHIPREAQARFSEQMVRAIGFDLDAGRIDVSTHPFCSSTCPDDVRLTTRYDEHFMPKSLFGSLHEAGHGLYEQGLDSQHANTPAGRSISLGIHESQSRMWENLVGRSRAFWEYAYPLLQAQAPMLRDIPLDAWFAAINSVKPSLIRVEADEVTYGLHIFMRFDLERRLIDEKLAVRDIPDAWNTSVREMLGITPPNDAQGCLQDIHWSLGIFGYFPTYALGNLYAAQFYEQAQRDLGDLPSQFRRGEFLPLRNWLRDKIHRHGMRYHPHELVQAVTGKPLEHAPFVNYLRAKFRPLYGLSA